MVDKELDGNGERRVFDRSQAQNFRNMVASKDSTNPKDLIGSKKAPLTLLPLTAIIKGNQVMKHGAVKYGPYNFRQNKIQYNVYLDALLRHAFALADGEDVDPDSGEDHKAHIMANVAILIDAEVTGNLIDNRFKSGKISELLNKYDESTQVPKHE